MKLNWAERWAVNNPLRVFEQKLEIHRLKQMLPLQPGVAALEIGCGRGAGARVILREFNPSRIYAMDLDIVMIDKAKHYLTPAEQRKISLFAGDASALPVKTQSLDAVIGFGVLHHVEDWRAALAEIARVLKPKGIYFFEELYPALYQNFITRHILLHPATDRFTGGELRQALADVNFSLKDSIEWKRLGILGAAVKSR
jgi:ubiquinone/menaquinone biosynthesis C-methylase UbiE